ncbi:hypothetical protein AVEN_158880-1 [Araneus ventricosus]|uniref:Uncharacterized protein n=1 Tax=Araneus ventricosus TaxID=182803 RepID=A0A4Y2B9L6_ARAVE|nr:hypothetical protein AVEN_158880-1 [Araneus ventricosus]
MFVLAAKFLSKVAKNKILHWHFLEAGHGKGAPDGVGGCLKRTADRIVARGIDIPNIDVPIDQLKIHRKGVNTFRVASAEINDCDKIEVTLPSFTSILRAHEISWTKEENLNQVRRLTCTMCLADQQCHHYTIGQILIKAKDSGDSDSDDEHIIDTNIKKRRLCYSEVYSDTNDSDSSSSMQNYFNDCLKNPKVNYYIIVTLSGKKSFHYYIGLVLQHHDEELVVKFMKKSSGKKFVFPEIEDISSIDLKDIICILNQLLVNNRQHYEFIINEKYMKLL